MRARDIMTKAVVSVSPTVSVAQVAGTLAHRGFTALPVVDGDGALMGIVSEADLIQNRFSDRPAGGPDATVGDVMTTPVVAVDHDTDITVVARTLLADNRRCLPIVDGSTLVGIITRRDIIRALARNDNDIASDVRRHLQVLGGQSRWSVQVSNGEVVIADKYHDASDQPVVRVLAESVPGVIRATITTPETADTN